MIVKQFIDILDSFQYDLISGIDDELESCLTDQLSFRKTIYYYDVVTTEDKQYIITIRLNKFSRIEAKKIFDILQSFIGIQDFVFHAREINNESISYVLLATNRGNKGYCLNVHFLP